MVRENGGVTRNSFLSHVRADFVTVAALLAVTGLLASACNPGGNGTQAGAAGGPGGTAQDGAGTDPAGSNGGTAAGCTRETAARPAPASLFDAFSADVAALPGAAKAARVDKFLADVAAQGGTPLEDPATGRTIFLARGAAPWAVTSSLVGFDVAKATAMNVVPGTDLFVVQTTIPRGASFQYMLLEAGILVEDRAARTVVWDGVERPLFTPGTFNAVGHAMDLPKDQGRLLRHGKVHSTGLANDRDVFVYLPPRYDDASCPKLPSVLFHDGNESLTLGNFAQAADVLYAARPDLSAVLVFVSNAGTEAARSDEYSFTRGDDYVDFLVNQLWPNVTARGYRICGKASARGLAGASLGGLISTYAAFQQPDQWGWVGAQSASYSWGDGEMITQVTEAPKVGTRFYLDSGCPDDDCQYVDQMATVLADKSYDYVRITKPGDAHDWPFWNERLGGMLTYFRNGKTDCD